MCFTKLLASLLLLLKFCLYICPLGFDCNGSCSFLSYPAWSLLRFLDVTIHEFCQIWDVFSISSSNTSLPIQLLLQCLSWRVAAHLPLATGHLDSTFCSLESFFFFILSACFKSFWQELSLLVFHLTSKASYRAIQTLAGRYFWVDFKNSM